MTEIGSLDVLARLAALEEPLRRTFPGLAPTLRSRLIQPIVPESGSVVALRFLQAVQTSFDPYLRLSRIRFLPPRAVMQALPKNGFDAAWILFSADRFEPRGERFQEWIDLQRSALGEASLFALRLFPREDLERWGEPIRAEEPENISGYFVPVLSVAFDGRSGTLGEDEGGLAVAQLVGSTLLYIASLNLSTWQEVAESWDSRVATGIEDRIRELGSRPAKIQEEDLAITKLYEFWALHSDANQGSELIGRAADITRELDRIRPSLGQLVLETERVAAMLNDKRLASYGWKAESGVGFSREFQRVRQRLLALCAKLQKEMEKTGFEQQAAFFRKSAEDLGAEVSAILLGAFSAGKSTFLNTLLGLADDDHPLPTGGKPETATINILRYSPVESVELSYLDGFDLELFSPPSLRPNTERDRWKIEKVEIEALLTWLEEEALKVETLRVWRLSNARSKRSGGKTEYETGKLDRKAVKLLAEFLNRPEWFCDELELVERGPLVHIENLRFPRKPTAPTDFGDMQEFLKRPEIALRVDNAQFLRNLPVLQGLRFVDTPGTDSAISHHHNLARSHISKTPGAPILFCFDGKRVGSLEDEKNLGFLHDLAADRTFFVVTKRPDSAAERDEVRQKVRQALHKAGWRGQRVYLVDSIEAREHPEDSEWRSLTTDLRRFVDDNRTRLLREQGRGLIEAPLKDWKAALAKQLNDLALKGKQRESALADLERKIAEIGNLLDQSANEARKLRLEVLKGNSEPLGKEIEGVIQALRAFDCGALRQATRDLKLKEIQELVNSLSGLDKQLGKNLKFASGALHRYLKSHLTKSFPDEAMSLMLQPVRPEFNPLDLTGVYLKAAEPVNRAWWGSFRPQLEEKTRQLVELLIVERDRAEKQVPQEFDRMVSQYKASLRAIEERSWKASQGLSGGEQKVTLAATKSQLAFVERCLQEYAAIHTED